MPVIVHRVRSETDEVPAELPVPVLSDVRSQILMVCLDPSVEDRYIDILAAD